MKSDGLPLAVTLRNGLVITLREPRADDRDRIAQAVRGLSRESIYTRLFSYRNELTEAGLDRIMRVDPEHEVMLLATTGAGAEEKVIGSARYVAADGGGKRSAEVAFVVEEDYQGLGIASRLLSALADIARSRGIAAFEAEVLPENASMLKVFERCGFPVQKRKEEGVVHLTVALEAAAK
jgi:RimJ/RimL family protein N-acetyltransferase